MQISSKSFCEGSVKNIEQLLQFNRDLIEQGISVVDKLMSASKSELISSLNGDNVSENLYGKYVGPHLRHILEHYEALVSSIQNKNISVCYDARNRDRTLEKDGDKMRARLQKLQYKMQRWSESIVKQELNLELQAGMVGEQTINCTSTVGRELMFLASHTIHHYALVQVWCLQNEISLSQDFGKAPSTIKYEQN